MDVSLNFIHILRIFLSLWKQVGQRLFKMCLQFLLALTSTLHHYHPTSSPTPWHWMYSLYSFPIPCPEFLLLLILSSFSFFYVEYGLTHVVDVLALVQWISLEPNRFFLSSLHTSYIIFPSHLLSNLPFTLPI